MVGAIFVRLFSDSGQLGLSFNGSFIEWCMFCTDAKRKFSLICQP